MHSSSEGGTVKWIDALVEQRRSNTAFVLVTILNVTGSSPRAEQSKMVVTASRIFDSIGGGNLEYEAMDKARTLLSNKLAVMETHTYTLGQDLTQCCGGRVELLFECFPRCEFQVVLCGAGHVGKALVKILSDLPCQVVWLDSRQQLLSDGFREAGSPSNVFPIETANPYQAVETCPPNAMFLVMTHSHEIDLEFCEAILSRDDISFCGLIGSNSKAAKFRSRLGRKNFSEEEIAKLTSPVGLNIGAGKLPMEVAVAVAAQLLQISTDAAKEADTALNAQCTVTAISS